MAKTLFVHRLCICIALLADQCNNECIDNCGGAIVAMVTRTVADYNYLPL
jgi:hypothetical protein